MTGEFFAVCAIYAVGGVALLGSLALILRCDHRKSSPRHRDGECGCAPTEQAHRLIDQEADRG